MKPTAAEAWDLSEIVELLSLLTLHFQGCWQLLHSPKIVLLCGPVLCSLKYHISVPALSTTGKLIFLFVVRGRTGGLRGRNLGPKLGSTPPTPSHSYFEQRQQNILKQQPGQQPGFIKQIGAGGDFKWTVGEGHRASKQAAAAAAGERKKALAESKAATTTPMTGVFNGNTPFQFSSSDDKWFRSLPPTEMLPRHETLGGYIFFCNNDTMQEDLKRQLFGVCPAWTFWLSHFLLFHYLWQWRFQVLTWNWVCCKCWADCREGTELGISESFFLHILSTKCLFGWCWCISTNTTWGEQKILSAAQTAAQSGTIAWLQYTERENLRETALRWGTDRDVME